MIDIEFDASYRSYDGPPLTDGAVSRAEALLGYTLPRDYLALLRIRNGGVPAKRAFRTDFETAWAPDYFEILGILGIGGAKAIDSSPGDSNYLIREWGYPAIGVVFCTTPTGGHDAVMLDYRSGGSEPAVAYVGEDRVPHVVAATFAEFLRRLEPPPAA